MSFSMVPGMTLEQMQRVMEQQSAQPVEPDAVPQLQLQQDGDAPVKRARVKPKGAEPAS